MELKLKIKTKLNSKILLQLFIIFMISGCSTILPPTFEEQSATYNRTLEQYHLNQLFTNIIRAADDRPIAFVDIPSVLGDANTTSTLGGGLAFGADGDLWSGDLFGIIGDNLDSANLAPSQMYSEGFTFTQSTMDNATFWNELMTELPWKKLTYFQGNNYPHELILRLIISEFVIIKADGNVEVFKNDPTKPSHPEFVKLFNFLIKNKITFGKAKDKDKTDDVITKQAVLCIADNSKPDSEYIFTGDSYCNVQKGSNVGKDKLIIPMRSVKNIFEYLGSVAAAQLWDEPVQVELMIDVDAFKQTRMKNEVAKNNANKLLVVEKNSLFEQSFAYTQDLYGNEYIIPASDSGYSQKVVSFISELIILTKIPGTAGPSPGILVQ